MILTQKQSQFHSIYNSKYIPCSLCEKLLQNKFKLLVIYEAFRKTKSSWQSFVPNCDTLRVEKLILAGLLSLKSSLFQWDYLQPLSALLTKKCKLNTHGDEVPYVNVSFIKDLSPSCSFQNFFNVPHVTEQVHRSKDPTFYALSILFPKIVTIELFC